MINKILDKLRSMKKYVVAQFLLLFFSYYVLDVFLAILVQPEELTGLFLFSVIWSAMFAAIALMLPRLAGRIFFGATYVLFLAWSLTQSGFYAVFNKLMWLQDILYTGEGAGFLGDTLGAFSPLWWIGGVLLIALGVFVIWKFPEHKKGWKNNIPYLCVSGVAILLLFLLPSLIYMRDSSEGKKTSSYRLVYDGMYDAQRVYDICGLYHMTFRDIWIHQIFPITPAYTQTVDSRISEVQDYFNQREEHQTNEMTGYFKNKNVVLVMMESMDDWLITEEDTPTIYRLMNEGINFTDFYTPGYGTARTLNTEFCMNTGMYLPTTGDYVFDFLETNRFDNSLAHLATKNGYTGEVFHYNDPKFYSRGIMEPILGYGSYNSYQSYIEVGNEDQIYDECMLFDVPDLYAKFFRSGKTLNTIITRAAHLGYDYEELASAYALEKFPECNGKYGSEEEDCIRAKAKLVDEMFARLLIELERNDRLNNTVIIAITDHYAYGMDSTNLTSLSEEELTVMLERTPFFIWSSDTEPMTVEKTLNTSDFLPTVLNLLGIESPYDYIGQDAFDPNYEGYALFPDGTWVSDGVACRVSTNGTPNILCNKKEKELTDAYLEEMAQTVNEYISVVNLLLPCDYYSKVR